MHTSKHANSSTAPPRALHKPIRTESSWECTRTRALKESGSADPHRGQDEDVLWRHKTRSWVCGNLGRQDENPKTLTVFEFESVWTLDLSRTRDLLACKGQGENTEVLQASLQRPGGWSGEAPAGSQTPPLTASGGHFPEAAQFPHLLNRLSSLPNYQGCCQTRDSGWL